MPSSAPALWYARYAAPGEDASVVVGVYSTEFADGTVVELPPPARRPTGWVAEVHSPGAGQVPSRVLIADAAVPGAPLLWYVLLSVPDHATAVDLVAFSTPNRADGDVLDEVAFAALGIDWTNQAGAMRWDTASGFVQQVYVAPALRRRGVATKLGWAVACIVRSRGWAPLQVDGHRTDLGEAWIRGRSTNWRVQVPERTSTPPPMTPPAEAVGVPERNLVPDPQ